MNKKPLLAYAAVGIVVVCLALLIVLTMVKQRWYRYHYSDGLEAFQGDSGQIASISLDAGNDGIVPARYFLVSEGDTPFAVVDIDEGYITEHLKCERRADFINDNGQAIRTYGRDGLSFGFVDGRIVSFFVSYSSGVAVGSDFSGQSSQLRMEVEDLYRIFGEPSSVERVKRRPWYHN